jgi:hypothetical protein
VLRILNLKLEASCTTVLVRQAHDCFLSKALLVISQLELQREP